MLGLRDADGFGVACRAGGRSTGSGMSAWSFTAAKLLGVLPRARIGRAMGRLAERRWSRPVGSAVVGLYSRYYKVSLDECEPRRGGYTSFDAFFTRALRTGVRPIAQGARVVVCPADGRVESMG